MMEFLSPLAFTGVLALLVPLVIHLLSNRDAIIVKVGSIKFLEKSDATTSRRPKLTELFLLLLRAMLLLMLTLLLAEPIWKRLENSSEAVGWVLISSDINNRVDDKLFYQTLDSLKAAGYDVRLLSKDFPPIDATDTTNIETDNVWSLLKEADEQLPKSASIWIFTSDKLVLLRGERPTLHREVVWKSITLNEEKKWIQSARIVGRDSMLVISGESNAQHTRFTTTLQSELESQTQGVIASPQEVPQRALIFYDDNRKNDARYVEQGLRATADALHRKLSIVVQSSKETPQRASLIFWLSDAAPPESLVKSSQSGLLIVFNAKDDGDSTNGFFKLQNGEHVELTIRARAQSHGNALWRDGFGSPILEIATSDSTTQYFFYSRFSPDWNDLVLRGAFPEWLASLIEPLKQIDSKNDLRRATDLQRQPKRDSLAEVTRAKSSGDSKGASLQTPFWILATILFIIERIVSQRQSSSK